MSVTFTSAPSRLAPFLSILSLCSLEEECSVRVWAKTTLMASAEYSKKNRRLQSMFFWGILYIHRVEISYFQNRLRSALMLYSLSIVPFRTTFLGSVSECHLYLLAIQFHKQAQARMPPRTRHLPFSLLHPTSNTKNMCQS